MNKAFTTRLAVSGLLTAGLTAAALGLGAGAANAGGPYNWCPGEPTDRGIDPVKHKGYPGPSVNWDTNVCHTWWVVNWGMGNVSEDIWDGVDPPSPEALTPRQCPPIAFMCP